MRYVLVVIAVLIGWTGMAWSQGVTYTMPCLPSAQMGESLAKYAEQIAGAGLDPKGRAILLQVNPETKSFTVLFRLDGVLCLMAGGKGWVEIAPGKTGKGL